MGYSKTVLMASILWSTLAVSAHAQKGTAELKEISLEIAKSNGLYSQGFEKHQASLTVERYSTDGVIMAPGGQALIGRDGVLAFFNEGYAHGIRKINFKTVRIFGFSGDFVNEEGLYELLDGTGKSLDRGKYLVSWKRTKSGWKMYRDIFNTDIPAPK